MKILITGIAGFVGHHLAQGFLDLGYEVVGIYRKTLPQLEPQAKLTLYSHQELIHLPVIADCDCVIDCAADTPPLVSDHRILYQNNIDSITVILELMKRSRMTKLIYLSSMSAFGKITTEVVSESTPDGQRDLYGESKRQGEILIENWVEQHSDRSAIAIRLPGVVGAQSQYNFISSTYKNIRDGKKIQAKNKEAGFNNILHVDNLFEFIGHLIGEMPSKYHMLTLGSTEPITIQEVIEFLCCDHFDANTVEWSSNQGSFLLSFSKAIQFGFKPMTTRVSLERFVRDVDRSVALIR